MTRSAAPSLLPAAQPKLAGIVNITEDSFSDDGRYLAAADALAYALWVPIIHPCWSGSMSILVEGAAESVPSADVEVRDALRVGNRFG